MSASMRGSGPGKSLRDRKPKPITVSGDSLVKSESLAPDFGLVLEAALSGVSLAGWASANQEFIERELLRCGAILFRGFPVSSPVEFREVAEAISPQLLGYVDRAAARKEVAEKVFTSTEYPCEAAIPLHHEMSYSHNWPSKIYFYCSRPASSGGRTPIADDRRIYGLIPEQIKQRFRERGVMYVRNYGEGVDLSWQEAFQTEDRAAVESYCRGGGAEVLWLDHNRLRTRQLRQVEVKHPRTGEMVWFNHAHLFHHSSLAPDVAQALLSSFREEELPRNVLYGDGSPIEASVLDEVREIYEREAVRFPWRQGDVLLLDNFLVSHGREPFAPPREILVLMSDLYQTPPIAREG